LHFCFLTNQECGGIDSVIGGGIFFDDSETAQCYSGLRTINPSFAILDEHAIGESMDIQRIQSELAKFAAERDWEQFHSPKNLVMAVAGETGELVALFQWLTEIESLNIAADPLKLARIQEEMADVFIYLIRLAHVLNLDIEKIVADKIAENAKRYPIEISKGNAIRYSERGNE
jgi:NTP pyrophosphatase (non-canonical NTP hydrolase)